MREYDKKEEFIDKHYIKESEVIHNLRKLAVQNKCDHMFVAPSEARMLQSLIEIHGAKKIVEIGTLYGYSSYYLARGVGETGKVWTCEKNKENASIAKKFHVEMGVNNVEVVEGDAHTSLESIEKHGPFDAVFIDADKAGYPDYLRWSYDNLRVGGIIIADNTFLGGSVWDNENNRYGKNQVDRMLEFHSMFSDNKRFLSTIYTSHDGLAVGVKK